ncbi:hypothetical protein Q2T49_25550, partial [Pseudomonas aeruginosa]
MSSRNGRNETVRKKARNDIFEKHGQPLFTPRTHGNYFPKKCNGFPWQISEVRGKLGVLQHPHPSGCRSSTQS